MVQEHALRRWRKENKVTLAALAIRVAVTPSHLSEIECGHNAPSLDLAAKLSRETLLPIDVFVRTSEAAE